MRLTLAILGNTLLTALASLVMAMTVSGQGLDPRDASPFHGKSGPGWTSKTFDQAVKDADAEDAALFAVLQKRCHTLMGLTLAQCIDNLKLEARYQMTVHFRPAVGAGKGQDMGLCDIYLFWFSNATINVYILREDKGDLKAGTVCFTEYEVL